MLLLSKKEKPTTGAPVVEVKTNPIVTARTKGQIFNRRHLRQKKPKRFIYVAVRKQGVHHFAMELIVNKLPLLQVIN